MRSLIILVALISTSLTSGIHAQIVTDRPDQTESSSAVGQGNFQIESGLLVEYFPADMSSSRRIVFPTTLFRYGLFQALELRVVSSFESQKMDGRSVQGIGDLEVGLKVAILASEENNTEIAFLTHLLTPAGSKDLTGDQYGTINKLCISHQAGERVGVGYNVGYNYFGDGNGDMTYSLALGVGINEKAAVFVEPYGEIANMDEFVMNLDAGFTYLASEHLQFDLSFGTGLTHRMNFLSFGVSWLLTRDQDEIN